MVNLNFLISILFIQNNTSNFLGCAQHQVCLSLSLNLRKIRKNIWAIFQFQVRTLAHWASLTVYSTTYVPGEKPKLMTVREQRVTNICVHLAIGNRPE